MERERERELRREGGKSLLAYVKGMDPHLKHIDRPTTIRSPEHRSGWVNYPKLPQLPQILWYMELTWKTFEPVRLCAPRTPELFAEMFRWRMFSG